MKYLYLFLFAFALSLSSGSYLSAQEVDVTKVVADRNTKIFSDGKTTVTGYVNAVIKAKTKCCGGPDDVYMEIKIDDQGYVTSARALSGKNDCVKKALADVVRYIRWSYNKETDKPTIFPLIKVELGACPNSPDDNVYTPIPVPAGWGGPIAAAQPGQPPKAQPTPPPAQPNQPVQPAQPPKAQPAQPAQPPKTQPTPPPPTQPAPPPKAQPTAPPKNQPAQPPKTEKNVPMKPGSEPVEKCTEIAAVLPQQKYISQKKDLKPDQSHLKTTLNTSGPVVETPEYTTNKSEVAINIKSKLRQKGLCGLVHMLAELTVEPDGSVSQYRVFNANSEETRAIIKEMLCDLKFKPLQHKSYSIFEIKTDIDCPGRSRLNLEQVGYYFLTPEKSARQRVPDGDTLDRPKDN